MIPLASPRVPQAGVDAVVDLLEGGDLSTGRVVADFEESVASFVDREHGVAVASGSVALELALEATFERGDRIALSPYNCGAVLYSIQRTGCHPVFVDAEEATAAIDPDALARVAPHVDGVCVSHLFGHPARVPAIEAVAGEWNLTVVEDFAQAPGATVEGEPVGTVGAAGVCSFGATKNLTSAEGGAVVTDDPTVADYVRRQRSNTDDVRPPPRSVRMNDLEAAVGLAHLDAYDDRLARKRTVAARYREGLADAAVDVPEVAPWATHVYHAFPVLSRDAEALAAHLRSAGVETSRLYDRPLHRYEAAPSNDETYPVAERLADEVVLLPIHAGLDDDQVETVIDAVADAPDNQ